MTFLSTVDVAVLQNKHSLSKRYRWHATKKSGEECVKNILFVHQLGTEKHRQSFSIDLNGSASTTIPTHFIQWATTAVTNHNTKFHPYFYSNAFLLLS